MSGSYEGRITATSFYIIDKHVAKRAGENAYVYVVSIVKVTTDKKICKLRCAVAAETVHIYICM